ncbi:MAG: hypothetical protein HY539_05840 [Deltaproteobacteria bacterium]|nr:hypothetical protein [Deltaproteobacteria bacterium]
MRVLLFLSSLSLMLAVTGCRFEKTKIPSALSTAPEVESRPSALPPVPSEVTPPEVDPPESPSPEEADDAVTPAPPPANPPSLSPPVAIP